MPIKNSASLGFDTQKRRSLGFIAGATTVAVASPALAQFGGLGDLGRAASKLGGGLNLSSLTQGRAPITTNIADAKWALPDRDGYTPPGGVRRLTSLQRGANGSFVLQAGYYEFNAQSYCFHAGTHGPGGGDGYLYAPTLGAAAEMITTIRQNSFIQSDIPQRDVQSLIWAIIARAKLDTLSPELAAVASRLLTPAQYATLNRSALSVVGPMVMDRLLEQAPPALRQALQAEAQMRSMFSTAGTSFASLERVAVLTGNAPLGAGSIGVPSGRWSAHPDGYWIRFIPSGYSRTLVQLFVEARATSIGRPLDLCTQVAVPGNTSRQRLGMSNREYNS
jgi:hypothetical protein